MKLDSKRHFFYGMLGVYLLSWAPRLALLSINQDWDRYSGKDVYMILRMAEEISNLELSRPWNPWGYPAFLSLFVGCGMGHFSLSFWVQTSVSSLIAPLAFWAVYKRRRVLRAWIAGLACGCYPYLINLGCKLCWDAPYTVAILGAALMLLGREPRRPALAGFLAALSWWIRTPGLAIMLGFAVLLLLRRQWDALKRYSVSAGITVAVIVAFGSWLYGDLLIISRHHEYLGSYRSDWGGWRWVADVEEQAARRDYLGFALSNPVLFLKERAISLINFLCPWPIGVTSRVVVNLAFAGPCCLVMLGVLWALVAGDRRILRRLAPLWVVAVATLLLHVMLFSKIRYRVPVMPPLIVFAAMAIPGRRRRTRRGDNAKANF